uniref:Predicted protein n=1 Tax=Hordeum vulgare subsp. vulgare TaxID=112509 RepID=F2E911_HORVV|nr:predicted protein [Hordeum vulgare subsp. vulgare]
MFLDYIWSRAARFNLDMLCSSFVYHCGVRLEIHLLIGSFSNSFFSLVGQLFVSLHYNNLDYCCRLVYISKRRHDSFFPFCYFNTSIVLFLCENCMESNNM